LEAALGEARLRLSIPGWPEGVVESRELSFTIVDEGWLSWSMRNVAVATLLLVCGVVLWRRRARLHA
jgi:hypothetical protein